MYKGVIQTYYEILNKYLPSLDLSKDLFMRFFTYKNQRNTSKHCPPRVENWKRLRKKITTE